MEQALNNDQVEYILYHLHMNHFEMISLARHFSYGNDKTVNSPAIFMPSSNGGPDKEFTINDTPVLFPCSPSKEWYVFDKSGNVIFKHDIFKAAFYLLSGYQETLPYKGDRLMRFKFSDSIQSLFYKMAYPVVNQWFSILEKACFKFCKTHGIPFRKRSLWQDCDMGVMLTHDVDRVDKWTIGRIKMATLSLMKEKKAHHLSGVLEATHNYITGKNNSYWNFRWLKGLGKKYDLRSTWFFLPAGDKKIDAKYRFSEKRITELMHFITDSGDEIGLHSTYASRKNRQIMQANYEELNSYAPQSIHGVRQHWLSFKYPDTLRIHERVGLKYDSSWGFADMIGWRNGYCLPFKPYDVEKGRIIDVWEYPLCLMDRTLFDYMNLDAGGAYKTVKNMVEICEKYSGLFVLLWHNSFFEEEDYPGVTKLYKDILARLTECKVKSILPGAFLKEIRGRDQKVHFPDKDSGQVHGS